MLETDWSETVVSSHTTGSDANKDLGLNVQRQGLTSLFIGWVEWYTLMWEAWKYKEWKSKEICIFAAVGKSKEAFSILCIFSTPIEVLV